MRREQMQGPCLNATGRLDTADHALALFEAQDESEAARIAGNLKAMNDSRKELTLEGVEEAIAQIEEKQLCQDDVLVVYLPDVHEWLLRRQIFMQLPNNITSAL